MDDRLLLQQYVRDDSEWAFKQLVERHVNLVYAAAVRRVNDPTLAQDVVQVVFLLLAKKAKKLPSQVVLSGWLYRTTYFVASKALRSERRRKYHEREAAQMQILSAAAPDNTWKTLEPFVDQLMIRLSEKDRNALLLRYAQDKDLASVGFAMGLSEDAAQKRVSRALEKLRRLVKKRGLVLNGATLATSLAMHAAESPPTLRLAQSVVMNCLHKSVVTPGTYSLLQESLRQFFWESVGKTALAVVPLVACACILAQHLPQKAAEIQTASYTGSKNNAVAPPKKKVVQSLQLPARSNPQVVSLSATTTGASSGKDAANAAPGVNRTAAVASKTSAPPRQNLNTNSPATSPQIAMVQGNTASKSMANNPGRGGVIIPAPAAKPVNVVTNQIGFMPMPAIIRPGLSENQNKRVTPVQTTRPSAPRRPSPSMPSPSPGGGNKPSPF